MEFSVLGALSVRVDGEEVALGGAKPRALLTLLLLRPNQVVAADRLIEDLWEGSPPDSAPGTLQSHIAALRRALGRERLRTRGGGYLVEVAEGELDAATFEAELGEAKDRLRRGDPRGAATLAATALGRWRGPALGEFAAATWGLAEASRLEEARLVAIEALLEARLALGQAAEVVAPAEVAVADHPLRERLWALLITALYREGRQSEALRAYQRIRSLLGEELGIEPSAELRTLEQAVLTQDPALAGPQTDLRPLPAPVPSRTIASPALPSGVVNLLLTDVVGSTRLWHSYPAEIGQALASHDDIPETKFSKLGEDRIAYQVMGRGPPDLVYMPGSGQVIDTIWEHGPMARYLRRLATISRLIMFDRRGTGASDAAPSEARPRWETWADDALSVLDSVGSERAAIFGQADEGPTAMLFAATQPERTLALILANTTARFLRDDGYPWGLSEADADYAVSFLEDAWGTESLGGWADPDLAGDRDFVRWQAKSQRAAMSPKAAAAYLRWVQRTDVRQVLSSIRSPTLVLHCTKVGWITLDQGRYLAEHIRGSRFIEFDGANMSMYVGSNAVSLQHIGGFLKMVSDSVEPDRALAAVLFTDIVDSTSQAASLGDRRWRNLLDSHDIVARTLTDQHRGQLVKLTGDGVLARFDGPGRAIRCAFALRDALAPLGIEIRAGLHTGEVELRGDDIGGIAVHIAERVQSYAKAGELLVSETVPRLVAGSGIEFEDRGEHELKGVPGTWKLFAVVG